MYMDLVVKSEYPPKRFSVQRHVCNKSVPIAIRNRLNSLLATQRRLSQQRSKLWVNIRNELDLLIGLAQIENATCDVTINIEFLMPIGISIEDFSLLDTMKRKLPEVSVAIDGADQVADRVAGNQARWTY